MKRKTRCTKEKEGKKTVRGVWRVSIPLLMILLTSSVVSVVATAEGEGIPPIPNTFYGDVTLNGDPAPVGTMVSAYIDGNLSGSIEVTVAGKYGSKTNPLSVTGSSTDVGKIITFRVGGVTASETARLYSLPTPVELDLSATGSQDSPPFRGGYEDSPTGGGDYSSGGSGSDPDVNRTEAPTTVQGTPGVSATAATPVETMIPAETQTPIEEREETRWMLPGSGFIPALAGLFLVAYLMIRRDKVK